VEEWRACSPDSVAGGSEPSEGSEYNRKTLPPRAASSRPLTRARALGAAARTCHNRGIALPPKLLPTAGRLAAKSWLHLRERWAKAPPTSVLILAHMRSGSTLLHHLLLGHPDVIGCGERNATYRGPSDLRRLAVDAYYHRRELLRRRAFAVDQINHTRFLSDPALLDPPHTRALFLVRQPGPSVSSMVEVLGHHYGTTLAQAVSHYRTRLSDLERLAAGLTDPGRAFFLTYEALVNRTDAVLAALSSFLGLRPYLSARYDTYRFTGRSGDPSTRKPVPACAPSVALLLPEKQRNRNLPPPRLG
jgi:hypothetical protein